MVYAQLQMAVNYVMKYVMYYVIIAILFKVGWELNRNFEIEVYSF